eukprot:1161023-Pelagomonas_calceolata.AAC.3
MSSSEAQRALGTGIIVLPTITIKYIISVIIISSSSSCSSGDPLHRLHGSSCAQLTRAESSGAAAHKPCLGLS